MTIVRPSPDYPYEEFLKTYSPPDFMPERVEATPYVDNSTRLDFTKEDHSGLMVAIGL